MRTEEDSLGQVLVPSEAYWGAHTQRALENFPISMRPISVFPEFISALASVKQAAARANAEIGALSRQKVEWIDAACDTIIDGDWHDQFVVDVIQGGAGTSTNMNANEVIANVALELAGHEKGRYDLLHPIDDVNRCQSTNDTYPTALRIALRNSLTAMLEEHELLQHSFARKGADFAGVLKVGRTQLQDAVPMMVGQEFHGFATALAADRFQLLATARLLGEVNLGATAIGTGITAHPRYAAAAVRHLSVITGLGLEPAADFIGASSDTSAFQSLAGALKRAAVNLSKISNDLRLLSSGPQTGFGEIGLPPRQAGSSIMPGKVNPVIPEVVSQVAYSVAGAELTVTMAAEAGQLQLNAFAPVIAQALLQSLACMRQACWTLRVNCVDGIVVRTDRLDSMVSSAVGVVTALVPIIGYSSAAQIAEKALQTGRPVGDLVVSAGLMTREAVQSHLLPSRLSGTVPSSEPA